MWEIFGLGLFERHIGTSLPKTFRCKKVGQYRENGQSMIILSKIVLQQKMGNFVLNYNKNDLHHRKTYKRPHIRLLNSFFIFEIVFELLLF